MMPLIAPPRFLIDEIVLVDVLALFLSIAAAALSGVTAVEKHELSKVELARYR